MKESVAQKDGPAIWPSVILAALVFGALKLTTQHQNVDPLENGYYQQAGTRGRRRSLGQAYYSSAPSD